MYKSCFVVALAASLMFLHGCGPLTVRDAAAGNYVPARGGLFELHEDITISGGRTRAYLQDGAIVAGVNEFLPHCQLEIDTLSESPRTVHADSFTITRVGTRTDQVVQTVPLRLAALEGFTPAHFNHIDSGEMRRMYVYVFQLHSDRQPDVRSLTCGGAFDSPGLAQLPTLEDIARALGKYGTLRLQ